ncbi:MAG: response regulator transcription factor [Anaerolineae bacterium]|nr:response regulator transcription factor [Anaerolineae bacterium]
MCKRPHDTQTILAVDDDADVRATIRRTLKRDGHHLLEADNAKTALHMAQTHRPDMIIIDIVLGGTSGYELCTRLRTMPFVNDTPILFLSACKSPQDVAKALDCGGDDYLRKPFAPRELTARVRALLRRSTVQRVQPTAYLCMHAETHSVTVDNKHISLTPTEYGLLDYLCEYPDIHHTANDLLEKLWHYPPGDGDTALVRNHIRNLRRKIEQDPDHPTIIMSLHGRGYSVEAQIAKRTAPSVSSTAI